MKKAVIIYHSKTGITKRFAEEISHYLKTKPLEVQLYSMQDYRLSDVQEADLLLLGCWTHGLMIFLQHPDKIWVNFARQLPQPGKKNIALFTTYKIATGSMFRKMKKYLQIPENKSVMELKSRNGRLYDEHKKKLDTYTSHLL